MRAIVVWAFTAATCVTSLLLLALRPAGRLQGDLLGGIGGIAFVLMALAFATVGALIVERVQGNRVGWLFLAIGVSTGAGMAIYAYATYGTLHPLPATTTAAWLWDPVSQPTAALLGLAILLFPNGRLPSRRWQPVAAIGALSAFLLSVPPMFQPFQAPFGSLPNPLGTRALVVTVAAMAGWVLAIVTTAAGMAGAFVRLRRASGDQRQQLKLLLGSGIAVTAATALEECTWLIWPHGALGYRIAVPGLAFAVFAVATGVAMLRYRLYDVDIAINRGLVYATLTVLLAAAYALTALLLATGLGSGSTWATAAATLVVAIAFRPLRAVVQDGVDRRFARARYDALRRVQAYLEDLRAGRASPEAIEPLLRELLADPTLELRFFLPESHVYVDGSGRLIADDGRERTLIERGGAPMAMVVHRQTGLQRPDLLRMLVEAGGLAIEIARLHVELRRQLTEVEASRARIVAAGYAERRRIERDLHDGAQQRLVSIGLELRHVQHQTGADLDRAIEELTVAIDELRELAQGLPPSQLDAGLEPALRELAGRSPLPVEVRATRERFSTGLEATAYFIACEGLTNAIKHARASTVTVSAHRRDARLVVCVRDDGIGGATDGSGIRGLRDRVATHGGALHITNSSGTTLTAELPCGS